MNHRIPDFPHTPHVSAAELLAPPPRPADARRPVSYAVDVGLGDTRRRTSIVICARRADGVLVVAHTELAARDAAYARIADRVVHLADRMGPAADLRVLVGGTCTGKITASRVAAAIRKHDGPGATVRTYTWRVPGAHSGMSPLSRAEAAGAAIEAMEQEKLLIPAGLERAEALRAALAVFDTRAHTLPTGEDAYGQGEDLDLESLVLGILAICHTLRHHQPAGEGPTMAQVSIEEAASRVPIKH
ncbi:hypothetical protein ACMATS_05910 [Streptoverticillium reticulum]|uniref:hypothetical protein n=1 Tax=Streptoverticillium reticulum TaxID=1433415 RepID=UPI0039BFCC7F